MGERYINFNLDDPRADKLAEALSNKTCKKILGILAEKDMNASEVSSALKLPLNTIGYNLEKLVDAGLIEKSSGFLWSSKGKKIERYKISNRRIIISPKSIGMSVIPVLILSGIMALLLKIFLGASQNRVASQVSPMMEDGLKSAESPGAAVQDFMQSAADEAGSAYEGYNILVGFGYEWLWFLLGAIVGLIIFLVWNRKKVWG